MDKPWLSVIVSSHNRERWLGATLQSLVDQDDPGIEVVVIDGSVNDACLQVVGNYGDKLNIHAHRRPDLVSRPEKANFGVEQARGEWVCILDDDDLWLPEKCAKLREWLALQSDAVMHLHPCYIIDKSGKRLGLWRCPLPNGQSPVPAPLLLERLLVQNFIATPAPMIRRDAYLRVGGLDNRLWYTADWDLYLKIAFLGTVYYYPYPLACYRVHGSTLTIGGSRDLKDFRSQYQIVVNRHIAKITGTRANEILRIAKASIDVNTALAGAIRGNFAYIPKALIALLVLGPRRMQKYFIYSRSIDRSLPRLRALITGEFRTVDQER